MPPLRPHRKRHPKPAPAPKAPPSPPTSDIPHPSAQHAPSTLSSPSDFLKALISSNFDFPQIAARLTPDQLLEFTSDPDTLARLDGLLAFHNTCLKLRQTRARHAALNTLQSLVESTDESPVERRRAATSLLRATNPAPAPAPAAQEAQDPPPRPRATPSPTLTPRQVVNHIVAAFRAMNDPDEDSGLATVAAFLDHDATVCREPVPTDDELEAIDALRETEIPMFRDPLSVSDDQPPEEAGDRAVFRVWFALPHHKETPRVLKFELARNPDSRHPGCWLIDSLSTGPPSFPKP